MLCAHTRSQRMLTPYIRDVEDEAMRRPMARWRSAAWASPQRPTGLSCAA